MYDDHDKTYLIGPYVIEVWEGQHPFEHATCWKWRVSLVSSGSVQFQGFCDFQEEAHTAALKRVTYHCMASRDRDLLEALWPGFKSYRPGGSGLPDDD